MNTFPNISARVLRFAVLAAIVLTAFALPSCKARPLALGGKDFPALLESPGVEAREEGNPESLRLAADRHIEALKKLLGQPRVPEDRKQRYRVLLAMAEGIRDAAGHPGFDLFLRRNFAFYRAGEPDSVLVTGYYTPLLNVSRSQSDRYVFPIFGRPTDLVSVNLADFSKDGYIHGRVDGGRLVPYYSRAEIEDGGALREEPIMYADDRLALFFMHVQGSGVAMFDDGSRARLAYAGGNGHPYSSLGKMLIDDGRISKDRMSMEAIRDYFAARPDELDGYLRKNASYVFFKIADGGPFGSTGTTVTPGRAIAADAATFPDMGIAYLETGVPAGKNADGTVKLQPYRAVIFHQDAGAAITGPARVDLYFGEGEQAAFMAGNMKSRGTLYYLAPKE